MFRLIGFAFVLFALFMVFGDLVGLDSERDAVVAGLQDVVDWLEERSESPSGIG